MGDEDCLDVVSVDTDKLANKTRIFLLVVNKRWSEELVVEQVEFPFIHVEQAAKFQGLSFGILVSHLEFKGKITVCEQSLFLPVLARLGPPRFAVAKISLENAVLNGLVDLGNAVTVLVLANVVQHILVVTCFYHKIYLII